MPPVLLYLKTTVHASGNTAQLSFMGKVKILAHIIETQVLGATSGSKELCKSSCVVGGGSVCVSLCVLMVVVPFQVIR